MNITGYQLNRWRLVKGLFYFQKFALASIFCDKLSFLAVICCNKFSFGKCSSQWKLDGVNTTSLKLACVFFRWCVLTGNSLDYYKSYVKNSPKFGSIVLNSLCSVVSPEEREPGEIPMGILRIGWTSKNLKRNGKIYFTCYIFDVFDLITNFVLWWRLELSCLRSWRLCVGFEELRGLERKKEVFWWVFRLWRFCPSLSLLKKNRPIRVDINWL